MIRATLKDLLKVKFRKYVLKKMQFLSAFPDITKVVKFLLKNADTSRTQGVHYVIYVFFGSSLVQI